MYVSYVYQGVENTFLKLNTETNHTVIRSQYDEIIAIIDSMASFEKVYHDLINGVYA